GARVKASPLARRVARERGVDLQGVSGSGPGGRIVKADVEGRGAGAPASAGAAAAPAPATAPAGAAAPAGHAAPGGAPAAAGAAEKWPGASARETRALAERVRSGAITPPELGGGTFTVSNLGMYGVKRFAAIINPPQAAILSVGALEPRPVVVGGGLNIRNT